MKVLDKNGKEITSKGSVRNARGLTLKVHDGDDGNLYVFIGSILFPLSMLKPSTLEFIEEK